MKLCPRTPIRVPKDFGTRLCDISKCDDPRGYIGRATGKLCTTSMFSRRIAWYDNANPTQRLDHKIKSDKHYKPIGVNIYERI